MADAAYPLDFLSTIVNVNWGSAGGYVVVNVTWTKTVVGSATPPPVPNVTIKYGKGESLIAQQVSSTQGSHPATPIVQKFYFIWLPNLLPFPTASNYNTVVFTNVFGAIGYAGQFSAFLQYNTEQFDPPNFIGQVSSGLYTDLGAANAALDAYNETYNGTVHPPGSKFGYVKLNGQLVNLLNDGVEAIPTTNFILGEVDVTGTQGASAVTSFAGTYLIKVPAASTTMSVSMSPAGNFNQIAANGYHGTPPKGLPVSDPFGDSEAQVLSPNANVNSVISGPAGHVLNQVTVTVGGTGPGGGAS